MDRRAGTIAPVCCVRAHVQSACSRPDDGAADETPRRGGSGAEQGRYRGMFDAGVRQGWGIMQFADGGATAAQLAPCAHIVCDTPPQPCTGEARRSRGDTASACSARREGAFRTRLHVVVVAARAKR